MMTRLRSYECCIGLATLFLAAAAAGCSGNDNGTGADTTRPTVSSTVPADGAPSVATNNAITAAFSEAMAPESISGATFTITGADTSAVAGTVTYAGQTATFTPTSPLAGNTPFTASVTTGAKDVAGNALAAASTWSFTTGSAPDTTPPTVASTAPADGDTSVATNDAITATFSEAMAPESISVATFTITGLGAGAVAGTVTYAGQTATFTPTSALAANTPFNATVTTGAKDLAGNALAAASTWSFTTGNAPDTTPPTVASTVPADTATGVTTIGAVSATFSEAMAPASITSATFTITGPGASAVPGTVTYKGTTATFNPTSELTANAVYTGAITSGAKDLADNALAAFSWHFTTGAAHVNLPPVLLGTAANYVILAKSAISTVPPSAVTGDVALSPAAASFITGFGLIADSTNVFSGSTQVTGKLYAANYAVPTPTNLTTAVGDMLLAYTDAAGRPTPDFVEFNTGDIGGQTLKPGLYKWTGTVTIPADVTLTGTANDVWIFQIAGDLSMSPAKHVFLSGGALAKNVFWQVAGAVDVGTSAHFEGIVLSKTGITLETTASMNGRALAQTAVVIQQATVVQPAP
jgi:hypothetical protein